MRRPPPRSTLFPYTALFRSFATARVEGPAPVPARASQGFLDAPPGFGGAAPSRAAGSSRPPRSVTPPLAASHSAIRATIRSEEHTSELQSRQYLVFRLLLEK